MLLAKVEPKETLQETIELVYQLCAATSKEIEKEPKKYYDLLYRRMEPFAVPMVMIRCNKEYRELHQNLLNLPKKELRIYAAAQVLRFRLDETGATVSSMADLAAEMKGRFESDRKFIFDRPFLLLLREGGSDNPYFAMWVETPEVMLKP